VSALLLGMNEVPVFFQYVGHIFRGFRSIPAQLKFLREYAQSHEFNILREFVDVETAKTTGRKQFGEMVRFLHDRKMCRVVLVEKTDRLYRNFRDCVTLEDLDVEIHLPKEGQVISKDSKSQAKLVHGIQLVIARNYIGQIAENGAIELRRGRGKCLSHLQKALRHDLRTGENRRMVGPS
jgi:hypothetical protein